MTTSTDELRAPAGWVRGLASGALVLHLGAILVMVVSAPSGPWPVAGGQDMATPPQFAQSLYFNDRLPLRRYVEALKFTHNYHFLTNRPGPVEHVTAKVKAAGAEKTIELPTPGTILATTHRHLLLTSELEHDDPVEALPGEFIPAPNQPVRTVRVWQANETGPATINTMPEHLVPRNQQVSGPSDWSLVFARSYGRYLLRRENADSVELVRQTKDYIDPGVMFLDSPPMAAMFNPFRASFGVIHASE